MRSCVGERGGRGCVCVYTSDPSYSINSSIVTNEDNCTAAKNIQRSC